MGASSGCPAPRADSDDDEGKEGGSRAHSTMVGLGTEMAVKMASFSFHKPTGSG